ncbi:MAG: hypothetical protein ACRELV_14555, partial [Longimicrobiales bacterium]
SSIILIALAIGVAVLSASVVYGLTVEYGGGGDTTWSRVRAGAELGWPAAALVAVLTLSGAALWPGQHARARLVTLAAVVTTASILALGTAGALGSHENYQRLVETSENFRCEMAGPEVDEVFQQLEHPWPIYGIGEGIHSCTAAVSGDEHQAVLAQYDRALHASGWRAERRDDRRLVTSREGLRFTARLEGEPDQIVVLNVEQVDPS